MNTYYSYWQIPYKRELSPPQEDAEGMLEKLEMARRLYFGPEEIAINCPVKLKNGKTVDKPLLTVVNFPEYFNHPIEDLKTLEPTFKPQTDRITAVKDNTFNGLFPGGYPCIKQKP
jgi:hypothetical protein